jgi:RNA polymerase sigma-70 factor (ECF subfamily)
MIESANERDEETALLRRAQAGDRNAFAALCERHRRRIWRVAAGVAATPADADDLAQEAILRALRSLASFRGESSFAAWICRIALNAAHDFQRSAWSRHVLLRGDNSDGPGGETGSVCTGECGGVCGGEPHEKAARRETQRRVRAAVAGLGAKERVPIYLIYFEEFTLAEVSRLERVPESTIRSRVKVGLKRLGKTLGDLGYPEIDAPQRELSEHGRDTDRSTVATAAYSGDWKECRT